MQKTDFIIVGQGLAGTLLAYELIKNNQKIVVINNPEFKSASSVAGGMFNPVTGKYLKKTWLDKKLLPFLEKYYSEIERISGEKIVYNLDIFRPFSNLESKEHFLKLIELNDLEEYVEVVENCSNYEPHLNVKLGGLITKKGGWVDVPLLLDELKKIIVSNSNYLEIRFDFEKLETVDEGVKYQNILASKIVFCEGYYVKDNPYFNYLPFNSVKGETLIGEIENYNIKDIVNQGLWLMPMANNKVRLGATYEWDILDFENTEEARSILLEGAKKFLNSEFKVENQLAGVRPSTQDRRPFVGEHPTNKNLLILNGLGTKGVSLAPYFIDNFVDFLLNNKDICEEVNINRILSFKKKQ